MGNATKTFFGVGMLLIIISSTLGFFLVYDDFSAKTNSIENRLAVLENKKKQITSQQSLLADVHDSLVKDLAAAQDQKAKESAQAQLDILHAQELERQRLLDLQRQQQLAEQKAAAKAAAQAAAQAAARRATRAS